MTQHIRVFVNERALDVIPGSSVIDVVESFSAELAGGLMSGKGHVTDGVGREIGLSEIVPSGAILRTVGTGGKSERDDA